MLRVGSAAPWRLKRAISLPPKLMPRLSSSSSCATVLRPTSSPDALEALRRQYGGRIELTGDADSIYERHLLFDNVTAPETTTPREHYEAVARSPEARGRSERCFGTIQGRLPQELRLHGIRSYQQANRYLDDTFIPDFNRRFTVQPAQPGSAFTRLAAVDITLLVSIQHERVVANDNTVAFGKLSLQLPRLRDRLHLARCPVLVHELLDDSLGVSFGGKLIARFNRQGAALPTLSTRAA